MTPARPAPTPADASLAQATIPTPLGPLRALAGAEGLHGLWFDAQAHHPGPLAAPAHESPANAAAWQAIAQARAALAAYFGGARTLPAVALAPRGTPFQQQVWQLLRTIESGRTATYGGLAQALGRPNAARAVGAAVGRNPISILVPCHRVVGGQGALTGYAGGLARKRFLLDLEHPADIASAAAR